MQTGRNRKKISRSPNHLLSFFLLFFILYIPPENRKRKDNEEQDLIGNKINRTKKVIKPYVSLYNKLKARQTKPYMQIVREERLGRKKKQKMKWAAENSRS